MLRKVQNNHLGKSVLFCILQLYKKQYSHRKMAGRYNILESLYRSLHKKDILKYEKFYGKRIFGNLVVRQTV